MTENRMYSQRTHNTPVFRGCSFSCVYCSFKRLVQMNKKCPDCAEFKPHSHMEVLSRKPPKTNTITKDFITVGLAGDVSFMNVNGFCDVLDYCSKWGDRTFLIQSKNPEYFLQFAHRITSNIIIGTTIETNREQIWKPQFEPMRARHVHYNELSKAPLPEKRYEAMLKLTCRKAVTIEPVLFHDTDILVKWIKDINPELCWVGYDNHNHKLPELPLEKTLALIDALEVAGIDVRRKTLRPAWFEVESYEHCLQCGTLRPRQITDDDSMFCTSKCKREYEEHEKHCSVCCEGGDNE